ncbi:hypothetical protein [Paraliomyxa miuraensis]|uniref:hypothetical protein n=1 Tax=Paraliomyxa miuraensis TaxID=376150 RepID=UPI0022523BE3|nr:hypothetical protein [Paraliomyxa miuraensis]MCX4246893.1 hypothetical protein [Paraliomyxa miuraensis]
MAPSQAGEGSPVVAALVESPPTVSSVAPAEEVEPSLEVDAADDPAAVSSPGAPGPGQPSIAVSNAQTNAGPRVMRSG